MSDNLKVMQCDPRTGAEQEVGVVSREYAIRWGWDISADDAVRVSPMLLAYLIEQMPRELEFNADCSLSTPEPKFTHLQNPPHLIFQYYDEPFSSL